MQHEEEESCWFWSLCSFLYAHVFRYFLHQEVGHFFAVLNCMIATFWLGFLTLYLMKPWGFTSWNRNLVKNKKRFVAIGFRRLREELAEGEDQTKLEKRQNISALGFHELRNALQKGQISAVDAVDAFRWKALQVHEKLNCVTEFVKEAKDDARRLDEEFRNKPKPPLFGMPFSVKDNFYMKGYDCTCGLAKNCEAPVSDECTFVTNLRNLGAVPIVRTNVPQSLLSFVCTNLVFGTTGNPHDVQRTPGGSSGGEGALIAGGGCPFGVGSDLAGSLRIPAHMCGLFTLKPTSDRIKVDFAHVGVPGASRIKLSYGYFTKDVESLKLLMSLTLTDAYFRANPLTAPIPYRDTPLEKRPLRIGYFTDDGWLQSVPACERAVSEAVNILKAQGHELVPFTVPRPKDAISYMMKALFPDNAKFWCQTVEYEDVDPLLKPSAMMLKCPLFFRWVFGLLTSRKWTQLSVLARAYSGGLADLRQTYGDTDVYIKEFIKIWKESELDALVCPSFPFPAIPHEYPAKLGAGAFICGLFNVLDFPAGVVPITHVTEEDDRRLDAEYPRLDNGKAPKDLTMWDHPIYFDIRKAAANSKGLPVTVQVVTLPYEEEKCLQVMSLIKN